MYVIELTPKSKDYPKHIWKEGGEFNCHMGAEFHASQIRKIKGLYKKVEVIINPLRLN